MSKRANADRVVVRCQGLAVSLLSLHQISRSCVVPTWVGPEASFSVYSLTCASFPLQRAGFFFFPLKKLGIRKRCWQLCMLGTIPDCWVMTSEFQSYLLPVNGHVTFSRFAAWSMTGHQSMVLSPEVTLESFRQLSNTTGAWVHPLPFGSESQGRGGHGLAWWSLVRKNPQVFWPSPRMENPWISCSVSCLLTHDRE